MKQSTREDISEVISRICNNDFDRVDVKSLLLDIRDYLNPKSQLRDVANCIHPERDRGEAFNKIHSHVENFLNVGKHSGILTVTHIYNRAEVISELIDFLNREGFEYDDVTFTNQSNLLIDFIIEFLDGTKINLKTQGIKNCQLMMNEHDNKKNLYFSFNFSSFFSGIFNIPADVSFAMPFFDEIV